MGLVNAGIVLRPDRGARRHSSRFEDPMVLGWPRTPGSYCVPFGKCCDRSMVGMSGEHREGNISYPDEAGPIKEGFLEKGAQCSLAQILEVSSIKHLEA